MKFIAFVLAVVFVFAFSASAIAIEAATIPAAAPIAKADFSIKVGKGTVNLIDQGLAEVAQLSKKKLVRVKDEDMGDYYTLKTSEAIFTNYYVDLSYWDTVILTKKGATARGIKIGSTEKALLAAYPKPLSIEDHWNNKNITVYSFGVPNPESDLTVQDIANLQTIRPLYYYTIIFNVSKKTKKITGITIMQQWEG